MRFAINLVCPLTSCGWKYQRSEAICDLHLYILSALTLLVMGCRWTLKTNISRTLSLLLYTYNIYYNLTCSFKNSSDSKSINGWWKRWGYRQWRVVKRYSEQLEPSIFRWHILKVNQLSTYIQCLKCKIVGQKGKFLQ